MKKMTNSDFVLSFFSTFWGYSILPCKPLSIDYNFHVPNIGDVNTLHLVELQGRVKQFCLSLGHISVFKNGYLFMSVMA